MTRALRSVSVASSAFLIDKEKTLELVSDIENQTPDGSTYKES